MKQESEFIDDLDASLSMYEQMVGGHASRTRNMIEQHGEVEALSRLVTSPDLQAGFKTLRDGKKLDSTFEAVITRPCGQIGYLSQSIKDARHTKEM